jgi:hypothetical protein
VGLIALRRSAAGVVLATVAWAAGCATAPPRPMMDGSVAAGAYTPTRIAIMPPDVFVVLDQVGDNDPVQSAALGQAVSVETVRALERALRARGYDVDLSARWDGIFAQNGQVLVGRDELGWLANGILQFANGRDGALQGPVPVPRLVAPELAARVGWATQSDALLYVNIKGVTTTPGKRTASVLAAVFIVVIVAAIVVALVASGKGGGGSGHSGSSGSWHGSPPTTGRAPALPAGGGWHGTPPAVAARPPGPVPTAPTGGWRGGGRPPAAPIGAPVYVGGPNVSFGVGVVVPLDGPVYTHDGTVSHEDEIFAGDELYVSMTMVSTYDGRVLWHARTNLDLDAEDGRDVDAMVETFLGTLPARPGFQPPPPRK